MKAFFLMWLLILQAAFCQTNAIIVMSDMAMPTTNSQSEIPIIKTKTGKVYKSPKIEEVYPDGLLISHTPDQGGIAMIKLKFGDLSEEIQKQHGYNPTNAAAFSDSQSRGAGQWLIEAKAQQTQQWAADKERDDDNFKSRLELEKLEYQKRQVEAAKIQADADKQKAEAALIEARKPARNTEVNVQVDNYIRSSYY